MNHSQFCSIRPRLKAKNNSYYHVRLNNKIKRTVQLRQRLLANNIPLCELTPGLMTPEHDSRVREARRRTQTEGSLCPSPPQSFLLHFPPASDSAQTAKIPSTAPAQSL